MSGGGLLDAMASPQGVDRRPLRLAIRRGARLPRGPNATSQRYGRPHRFQVGKVEGLEALKPGTAGTCRGKQIDLS